MLFIEMNECFIFVHKFRFLSIWFRVNGVELFVLIFFVELEFRYFLLSSLFNCKKDFIPGTSALNIYNPLNS
jgi:hypothetical protein